MFRKQIDLHYRDSETFEPEFTDTRKELTRYFNKNGIEYLKLHSSIDNKENRKQHANK